MRVHLSLREIMSFKVNSLMESSIGITPTMGTDYSSLGMIGYHHLGCSKVVPEWTS